MKLSLSSPFFLIILVFPFIQLPKPSEATVEYDECKKPFSCGKVDNITYPFYDKDRPTYCGFPGFELNCSHEDQATLIMPSSDKYYFLGMNSTLHTVTLARDDLSDDLCPKSFSEISFNFKLFTYTSVDENVTLYYGCPEFPTWKITEFPCPSISGDGTPAFSYFMTTSMKGSYGYFDPSKCQGNITVPIDQSASITDPTSLQTAFRNGFKLEWIADNNLCDDCARSGGQCGHNITTSKFTCYCTDYSSDHQCSGKSNTTKGAVIGGIVAGVSVSALLIVCASVFVTRRRRRQRILSQDQSKGIRSLIPSSGLQSSNGFPSSQGFTTSPSNDLSPSMPSSYPSSGDYEGSRYFGVKVFSFADLEEATENFHESRELGDGGFGTVYYGKLHDGRAVAVKRLYENSCKHMGQFTTEIKILARLRHKNLVTLYGCSSRRSRELLLVYEFISNGTVADHLHGKLAGSNKLAWPIRLSIAVQTADALAFLHKSDVVHRDVKTTNILLDENFQVKVADFGLSRLFPTDVTHVSTAPQGTPGYVDPEYYQCYQLTEKSDVYSFGVVLMELISSKPAVDITRHRHDINLSNMAIDRIKNNAWDQLVDPNLGFDKDYGVQKMVKVVAELGFRCLQHERDGRPSMDEVLDSLRAIEKEMLSAQKQVVLDIQSDDDAGLLKNVPPPLSPETEINNARPR